jgi:hypothetical protein
MNIRLLLIAAALAAMVVGVAEVNAEAIIDPDMTPEEQSHALPLTYECLGQALIERAQHYRDTHIDTTDQEMYARAEACMNEAAALDPVLRGFLARQPPMPATPPPTEGNWTSPDPTTPPLPS